MKSYADDLPNADKVLEELRNLTQTVIDANDKSTIDFKKELIQLHNTQMEWIKRIEDKQHGFRLMVMSGLGLNLVGVIGIVVKLYFLPLL